MKGNPHRKGNQTGKGSMTNSDVKRMILKLKATGCLDDKLRSGQPNISANAVQTVQEEMEILAGSSMHGEVCACMFAHPTGTSYTTVLLALWCILLH